MGSTVCIVQVWGCYLYCCWKLSVMREKWRANGVSMLTLAASMSAWKGSLSSSWTRKGVLQLALHNSRDASAMTAACQHPWHLGGRTLHASPGCCQLGRHHFIHECGWGSVHHSVWVVCRLQIVFSHCITKPFRNVTEQGGARLGLYNVIVDGKKNSALLFMIWGSGGPWLLAVCLHVSSVLSRAIIACSALMNANVPEYTNRMGKWWNWLWLTVIAMYWLYWQPIVVMIQVMIRYMQAERPLVYMVIASIEWYWLQCKFIMQESWRIRM